MNYTLKNPASLQVHAPGSISIGGSQEWYSDRRRRMSGCGPTAASNLIWYMTQSQCEMSSLSGTRDVDDYKLLQNEMFTFVPPGIGGVNSSAVFVRGVMKYGHTHGIRLVSHVLEIPMLLRHRPTIHTVRNFVLAALESDCPVAFLNLTNGNQHRLESWHWVTIIEFDPDTMIACVCDQGRVLDIDLAAWLKTSLLGGALIYLSGDGLPT